MALGDNGQLETSPVKGQALATASQVAGGMSPLGVVGLGLGGLAGVAQSINDIVLSNKNFEEQKKQNEWEKQMQQTAWEREDSAVQRRMADMKKAGINPLLAAGQAASSSNPINIGAPQRQGYDVTKGVDKAITALSVMKAMTDNLSARQNLELQKEQVRSMSLDNELKEHDLRVYRRSPDELSSSDSGYKAMQSTIREAIPGIQEKDVARIMMITDFLGSVFGGGGASKKKK